jgi:polysaccharide biosynthesis protein PslA
MADVIDAEITLPRSAVRLPPYKRTKPISREIVSGCIQLADFVAILIAGAAAFSFYLVSILGNPADFERYGLTAAMGAIIFAFFMRKTGAYEFERLEQFRWQLSHIGMIWAATTSMMISAAFLTKVVETYSRGWSITYFTLCLGSFLLIRLVLRGMLRRWRSKGRLTRLVAIVGTEEVAERLIAKLESAGSTELEIAGVFDARATRSRAAVGGYPVRGTLRDLVSFAQTNRLDEVVIALPLRAAERIGEIVNAVRMLPVDIRLGIDAIPGSFPITGIGTTASVPVIKIQERPLKHWNGVIKGAEDRLLGALALFVFSPLMIIIAAIIRIDSSGPIFFVQDRFGFNNRPIRVFKFRTMHVDRGDPSGAQRTIRNDPRITRVGRFLRASSLDELPQLFNVLRGEMSLVGPRAHAVAMKAGDRLYHEAVGEYFQRHKVRPGMTGWAQVNGFRGEIAGIESARNRVAYDLHYIEHWSLWLDLKVLLMTVRALCSRQNAY